MTRLFEPEQLLTPVPNPVRLAAAVICGRRARDRENPSASSLSRGLYVAAAFFGTLTVLAAVAVAAMGNYDHLGAVIGALFLFVVSLGAALNARGKARRRGAT